MSVKCPNKKTKRNSGPSQPSTSLSLLSPVNEEFDLAWLTKIFVYRSVTEKERLLLRSYSKLFSKALEPLPCWAEFPDPKYKSLNLLFRSFDGLARSGSSNIPKVLFLKKGQHVINIYSNNGVRFNYLTIARSIIIVGENRDTCVISGGLKLRPPSYHPKNGKCVFRYLKHAIVSYPIVDFSLIDCTLVESLGHGIWGLKGTRATLNNVNVCGAAGDGLSFEETRGNTMKNCGVNNSYGSGVELSDGATLTIDGKATTIHDNCKGNFSCDYGIHTITTHSYDPFALPLGTTIDESIVIAPHLNERSFLERMCKNNHGGGNYGNTLCSKVI